MSTDTQTLTDLKDLRAAGPGAEVAAEPREPHIDPPARPYATARRQQAGALRHGISRALTNYEPGLRGALKAGGYLTRDSRVVERKKYGRAGARRSFQYSKR